MKPTAQFLVVAVVAGALCVPAALAQSSSDSQNQQQNQQAQTQQGQPSQDQYTGVSHPPPDSTIQANEDMNPPPPPPAAKPSPAIPTAPVSAPPAAAPAPTAPMAAAPAAAMPANPEYAGEVDNTDSGIVTVVPSSTPQASLQERGSDADGGIVNYVPVNPNDLAPGTNISVRLSEALSTNETQPGTPFRAVVTRDVYNGSNVIIPAGAEMRGRVVSVSQGHHFGLHATIRLRPEAIVLPDGTAYHLYADVIQSDAPGTRTDNEGGIEAASHYKKDAVEYGAGAGGGALIGGEVGGPVGAGVGTLVGAGVVTTHLLLQDPQAARLPEGSILVFSLTEPMGLTPTKN